MRVTFDPVRDGLPAINTAAANLAEAQQQVATGRRINLPSDDPQAMRQAIGEYARMGAIDAYSRADDSAASRLSAADTTLTDMVNQLTTAIATATGAQGSTANQTIRDTAAATLQGVRDSLLSDINATFQGASLFAGGRVGSAAYAQTESGWTYQGDQTAVQVAVQDGRSVSIATDGRAIMQGGDATDVLTVLDGLIQAVKTGDDATTASGIQALQRAFSRATDAQSQVGTNENAIDEARTRLGVLRVASEARRSKAQDVNLADAATRMQQADTAYKAALGAVSTVEKLSLLDYLR